MAQRGGGDKSERQRERDAGVSVEGAEMGAPWWNPLDKEWGNKIIGRKVEVNKL